MGSPFPRQSNSYLFVVVRKIKENADKRTKKTRCLQASGIKSDQLLFHTSSSRTGGISHWANRDHMLTWLQTGWLRGMSHPWNISIIFTEPNPHWLCAVTGLGCQGGSALLLPVLCDVDEHKRLRHQLCRCLCLLPTSVGHLEGLQTCWAAATPSGCPKKNQLEKACDFSTVFFLDIDYCSLPATSWFLSSEILGILMLL